VRRARSLPFVVVALVALAAACGSTTSVAARVGDDEVSQDDLTTAVGVYRSIFAGQQGVCGLPEPGVELDTAACDRAVLGDLVLTQLAEGYATDHGVAVSDAEVEETVSSLEERYGTDELRRELDRNGVTREDLAELVRRSLVQQAVVSAVTADRLGEGELRARYEERLTDLSTIEVDHILVESEAEANDVYEAVTQPGFSRADFKDLAREVSTDPGVAENGGTYGPEAAATFDPDFAAGALALEPGEISRPVESGFGWHVIRLESKDVPEFDEVRDQIVQDESPTVFADWLRELLDTVTVDVNPRLGRWDDQTFTIVRVGSTDPSADASVTPGLPAGG
jgi:foldase protein PrsA